MVHDSMKTLQFDRRMRKRRGWVKNAEYDSHLSDLPDVADKGEVVSDSPVEQAPAAAPAPASTAPASTGFGAPPSEPPSSGGSGSSDPALG